YDQYQDAVLLQSLRWLLSDRAITAEIGNSAREWVASTCTWQHAARQHIDFLKSLDRRDNSNGAAGDHSAAFLQQYLTQWTPPKSEKKFYLVVHIGRLVRTLQLTPHGAPEDRILEMGCYLQITPALQQLLGYGYVRGSYLGAGGVDPKTVRSRDGGSFSCAIDLFDAELDVFPYP